MHHTWLYWLLLAPGLYCLLSILRLVLERRLARQRPAGHPEPAELRMQKKAGQAQEILSALALPPADREDVADELRKLVSELSKDSPEPLRVRRYLGRVREVASPVAEVFAAEPAVAEILGNGKQ
jgi:hypothetical protein